MSPPKFDSATVEEKPNGVIRIRGNAQSFNELLYVLVGAAALLSVFFAILQPGSVITRIGVGIGVLAFFLAFALFSRFFVTGLIHLMRSVTGHHRLWWDDFTYDGRTVKSRKYEIDGEDISYVESGIRKFANSDSWHYASIMNSNGVEIGRVMVVMKDKKKMVGYLADLFGVS